MSFRNMKATFVQMIFLVAFVSISGTYRLWPQSSVRHNDWITERMAACSSEDQLAVDKRAIVYIDWPSRKKVIQMLQHEIAVPLSNELFKELVPED